MATAQTPGFFGDRPGRGRPVGAEIGAHPARIASMVVGIVFALVGAAGFIPGLVDDFDAMTAATDDSQAELFGIFQVSVLHNIVHLAFGVLGLVAARTVGAARAYLIGGGLLYLALTLYGALIDLTSDWNFLPFDEADNWLHLGLGAGMVLLGLLTAGDRRRAWDR
jgi:hypothetical protein